MAMAMADLLQTRAPAAAAAAADADDAIDPNDIEPQQAQQGQQAWVTPAAVRGPLDGQPKADTTGPWAARLPGDESAEGSLQRQFLASLPATKAPPLGSAARGRSAPAGSLEARLQAALASERARAPRPAPPPGADAQGGSVQLTVLVQQREGGLAKCACRCDPVSVLGHAHVAALFQGSAAHELRLEVGAVLSVAPPYTVLPMPGPGQPAVLLCHNAVQQAGVYYNGQLA
jgi:hypothetical protein